MKHKIILIRHGESLANVDPSYYFEPDQAIILSEKGVRQALSLVSIMPNLIELCGNVKIISSKLSRAMITADIACHKLNANILRDHRINECRQIFRAGEEFESTREVQDRVRSLLEDHQDTSLILFCHGELMWHLDPLKPHVRNTEYRIYDREYFCNYHLKQPGRTIIVPRTR